MTRFLWFLAVPLVVGACTQVGKTFVCSSDAECSVGSVTGTCEMNHYCSIPSTSCATFGRAYDSSAGDGLGGTCVGGLPAPGGPSKCATFVASVAKSDCESFEDNMFSKTFGLYDLAGGVVSIGTDHVYRGTGSAHAHSPDDPTGDTVAAQLNHNTVDESSGSIALRGFFWIDTPPPWTAGLLSLQQSTGPMLQYELVIAPDGTIVNSDKILDTGSGLPGISFPLSQWVCVELDLKIAADGEVDAYLNDVLQPSLTINANTVVTPIADLFESAIYFNPGAANPIGAWDMWVDEIAIAPTHIGCDQ